MLEEDNVYTINQFGQMDLQKVNWGVETLPPQSTWFLMNQGNAARDIINKMIEPTAVVTDSHPIDISDFTNLSDEESKELTDRLNLNVDQFYYDYYPEFANTLTDYKITGTIPVETTAGQASCYLGVLFSDNHPEVTIGTFICLLINDQVKLKMYVSQSQLDHLKNIDHFDYETRLKYGCSNEFNDLAERFTDLLKQKQTV